MVFIFKLILVDEFKYFIGELILIVLGFIVGFIIIVVFGCLFYCYRRYGLNYGFIFYICFIKVLYIYFDLGRFLKVFMV